MNKQKAQVALEYMILFAMLAVLTIISLSSFFPRSVDVGEELVKRATSRITK